MIDLHCHILPGVDDGAASDEESLAMARLAVESGVTAIAATPHCNLPGGPKNYADAALRDRFLHLHRLLVREGIPLRLYTGAEVYATPEVPALLRDRRLLTLGGSRYLLIEFGFDEPRSFVERTLGAVADAGLTPVAAHPERYYFLQDDPTPLRDWAARGWAIQLNKGSLFGLFGRGAGRAAQWCMREGCVHLIGSDAHSPYRRTTRLSDVRAHVARWSGPEVAALLLDENPAAILADRPIVSVREAF